MDPARLALSFPDAESMPPLRARARLLAEVDPRELPGGERLQDPRSLRRIPVVATAVAEATLPGGDWTGMPTEASGGGYSGPLAYRNGKGMRLDVGRAFDLMAAAARRAGVALVVNSGFRSDAEQARLFAAHPTRAGSRRPAARCTAARPSWTSARRRRTAGSPPTRGASASSSATRWEAVALRLRAGPAPCSAAGKSAGSAVRGGRAADGEAARAGCPRFVPARFRAPSCARPRAGTSRRRCSPRS